MDIIVTVVRIFQMRFRKVQGKFPPLEFAFQRHNILSVLFGIHCPELTLHGVDFSSVMFIYHQHLPYFLCFNLSPEPAHLLLSKAFGFRIV